MSSEVCVGYQIVVIVMHIINTQRYTMLDHDYLLFLLPKML